jgi:hypothetical protein
LKTKFCKGDWLDKIQKLNFNAKIKIGEGLKGASKGYLPISLEKLKEENKALYESTSCKQRRQQVLNSSAHWQCSKL